MADNRAYKKVEVTDQEIEGARHLPVIKDFAIRKAEQANPGWVLDKDDVIKSFRSPSKAVTVVFIPMTKVENPHTCWKYGPNDNPQPFTATDYCEGCKAGIRQ